MANLEGVRANEDTTWPSYGFDLEAAGVVFG
jgi:hypothetical protein